MVDAFHLNAGGAVTNSPSGDYFPEPLDEEQFAAAVKAALDDAVDYIDGYVATQRGNATKFYRGDLFGNEEKGRSQFVMTELRDTVLAMLPGLLRIFCSSNEIASFEPRTAAKVEQAEQATDAVSYAFFNDNDGFSTLYNCFKDALVRKSGIIKYYWDETIEVAEYEFTDLSDMQLRLLRMDPETEIVQQVSRPMPNWQPPINPMTGQPVMVPGPAMTPAPLPGPPPQPAAPVSPSGPMPGMMPPAPPAGPPPGLAGLLQGPAAPQGAPPEAVFAGPMIPMPPPMLHDLRVRRHTKRNKIKVEALPPEEFLIARDARDVATASVVCHRKIVTYSDLVKMGYDPKDLDDISGLGDTFMWNTEASARNPAMNAFTMSQNINDESSTKVVYNEAYILIDKDGDGIAERRKVCMVGETVLHDEVVDTPPFVIFCPDPEPHMAIGNSVADQTMDLQLLKSNIVRNTLDSLAQSIHPRTAVVETQVNMDDVMNVETGAVIRMRAPGMVQSFSEPFVGRDAMSIVQWLDEVKAKRTGVVPLSAGLDPDALQSTTKKAVDATVQGAQERTEMTARLFAEGGMKPLMKGMLKLFCRHMDRPRMMRLRGKWVEVDPRSWDADMDVIVHVALGQGTQAEKLQSLALIAQKQEGMLQMGGITNPLADLGNYRATLAKMTETMGYKDVDTYFKPVNMQAIQMQQAQQPPPKDPNMVVAEAQAQKVQAQTQMDAMKLQLDQQQQQLDQQKAIADAAATQRQQEIDAQLAREEMVLKDQREMAKMRLDAVIRLQMAELQYGTQVKAQDTELELERAGLLADLAKHRESLDREEEAHVRDLELEKAKHQQTIDQKDREAQLKADAQRQKANDASNE